MRFVLWIVGAAWAAIGAWYLYTTTDGQTGNQLGNTILAGMLMYIFPGLVLMGLGSLLGRRHRDKLVVPETHARRDVLHPVQGAAAAGTGAAAMAAANDHAGHGGTDGHGPPAGADTAAARAYQDANARMHAAMSAPLTGNADVDFAQGMIAHHEGAIEMADLLLAHGRDARLRRFAENVKRDQSAEVAELRAWLKQQGGGSTTGR